jgi:hypothetical protein
LNISRESIADLITLLSLSVQNSEGGGDSDDGDDGNTVVLPTPAKNLNKIFGGF